MFVLKLIGKVCVLPVIIVLAVLLESLKYVLEFIALQGHCSVFWSVPW